MGIDPGASRGFGASGRVRLDEGRAILARDKRVAMEPAPACLLALLIRRCPQAVTNEEAGEVVWDGQLNSTAQVHVAIGKVRKALKEVGLSKDDVQNLRGIGYRLRPGLDIELAELPDVVHSPSPPTSSSSPWPKVIAALVLASVAILFGFLIRGYDRQPTVVAQTPVVTPYADRPWTLEAHGKLSELKVQPRNGAFLSRFEKRIANFDSDPELENMILSIDATRSDETTGQVRLDCFGCGDGWTRFIDDVPVFGERSFEGNEWSLQHVLWQDIDGDDLMDVAVVTNHSNFPSLLTVWNGTGTRVLSYMNVGHIKQVTALPFEFYANLYSREDTVMPVPAPSGTGVALAMSVELNEPPRGAGVIVLPPGFTEGSYPLRNADFINRNYPSTTNLILVRFLPSLVAQAFDAKQNWATAEISYDDGLRTIQVTTLEEPGMGSDAEGVIRVLNDKLQQVNVCPTDRFLNKYPAIQKATGLPALSDSTLQASFEMIRYYSADGDIDMHAKGSWCSGK